MTIAVDASSPAIASNNVSTATTASFSPPANTLLVACVMATEGSGTTITVSNTGTARTWTERIRRDETEGDGLNGFAAIYTAPNATALSGITVSASTNWANGVSVKVYVLSGADLSNPVGATGEGSSTTNSITPTGYSSTQAFSFGVACANENNGLGVPTSTDVGSGFNGANSSGIAVVKSSDTPTIGTNVTFNFDAAGAGAAAWKWVAAEIRSDSFPQTVTPPGGASGEAFGTAKLNLTVQATGITSGEAFGTAFVFTPTPLVISPSGVQSAEAFGVLRTRISISTTGIPTGEAVGAPDLIAIIGPAGIASGEAFGLTTVAIEQFITPAGVLSGEAFGTAYLQLGYPQTIIVEGIESGELVEDPTLYNVGRLVLVNPSIQETPAAWDPLNIRFGIHRGITIMRDSFGVWRQVRYPSQTEIEIAQRVYLGGRRHTITVDEANELIAAGYGGFIILEPNL